MEDLATRAHVVVLLDDGHVVLLREVRGGSVRYLAPGVAARQGETPGRAAARAAREQLGFEVEVLELLFADTEMGAEHFFFIAKPERPVEQDWEIPPPSTDGVEATALKRSALLGYPVRPVEIARLLRRAADERSVGGL